MRCISRRLFGIPMSNTPIPRITVVSFVELTVTTEQVSDANAVMGCETLLSGIDK